MGKQLATFGVDWVYFGYVFLWIFIASIVLGSLQAQLPQVFILSTIAYSVTMTILGRLTSKFILYENGVRVVRQDRELNWRWCEITSMTGNRTYISHSILPGIRYGAEHFYAENDRIFSVSVLIRSADLVVSYILLNMTICNLDKIYKNFKDIGGYLQVESLSISDRGLEDLKKNKFYEWNEISSVSLRNTGYESIKIFVQLKGKKEFRLGTLNLQSSVLFVGIIDKITGSKHLSTILVDALNEQKRTINLTKWILIYVPILSIIGVTAISLIYWLHILLTSGIVRIGF